MKHTTKKIAMALGLTALATASLPALAATTDLRVIGSINPASCTPTLGGGGKIDYEVIRPSSLSATDYTLLPVMSVPISIVCTAPQKAALRGVTGRPGTLAGATEGVTGAGPMPIDIFGLSGYHGVGLGLDGTAKIGGYVARINPTGTTTDVGAVETIVREGPTASWRVAIGSFFNGNIQRDVSWAASGTVTPIAFTTLSGQVDVQAYLNKSTELDLTKPITLDGLTTIELVYL